MKTLPPQPSALFRSLTAALSLAMWVLWIWMLVPPPIREAALQPTEAISARPTIHILLVLAIVYGLAVLGARSAKAFTPEPTGASGR